MKAIKIIFLYTIGLFSFLNISAQNAPCSGSKYSTDSHFFRYTASGNSMDMTTSKKKAMMKARTSITSAINSKFSNALISQNKCDINEKNKINGIIQIAIRQEVASMKIICEDCNKVDNKSICNLVVEVSKDNIVKSIIATINNDNTLNNKFDSNKFSASLK